MKTIVFDIETIPQNEQLLLARAPDFRPAANLKDPEKIKASILEKKERYLADAALHWTTAEVVLIGLGDGVEFKALHGDEKSIVTSFLAQACEALIDGCKVGGHNVKGFDLPMLINRARVLGATIPPGIMDFWKGRPQWADNIFDTLEILSFGNKQDREGCGVEDVCRSMGIKGKTGRGSDFPALWKSDREAAIAYNQQDVTAEIEIARMCGLM